MLAHANIPPTQGTKKKKKKNKKERKGEVEKGEEKTMLILICFVHVCSTTHIYDDPWHSI